VIQEPDFGGGTAISGRCFDAELLHDNLHPCVLDRPVENLINGADPWSVNARMDSRKSVRRRASGSPFALVVAEANV
jgi:hypothetical protein